MKISNQDLVSPRRIIRAAVLGAAASLFAAGCATVDMADPETADGRIEFNEVGCPTKVTPNSKSACTSPGNSDKICSKPGKHISWQSVDSSDDAVRQRYRIYFDPFKSGATIRSNAQGFARARTDDKAPKVEYKYTVIGEDCPGAPLDPRIILD